MQQAIARAMSRIGKLEEKTLEDYQERL